MPLLLAPNTVLKPLFVVGRHMALSGVAVEMASTIFIVPAASGENVLATRPLKVTFQPLVAVVAVLVVVTVVVVPCSTNPGEKGASSEDGSIEMHLEWLV